MLRNGEVAIFQENARAFFDSRGRITRLIGINADITERKRDEAALRESELRYKEIFDNFSECIFVLDVTSDGRFKFAGLNPAEERATGLSSTEVSGKFIEDVFAEDVAKRVISHYSRCLEMGTLIKYDDELNLPVGRRQFHTNLIPVRNSAGRIHRIVGCCIDITDLKRAQEEALARQKLESVGVVAGGIAHDFNNLLGSILAEADLALAELSRPKMPAVEEVQRIKGLALRASEIVRELMIYAGQETAHLESLDLSRLFDEMLQLLKVSISKHAILKTDLAKNLPTIQANATQMRQLVMNLITNASEAIGESQGEIYVTTELVSVPVGKFVRLEVSDTGCGMSPETLAKIFEPFFTTKFAGRGLGMAVVMAIVRNHGGAINVGSVPGQGTRVGIILPGSGASVKHNGGAIDIDSSKPISNAAGTVLLVEDEDALRVSVSKMLRKKGFSVIEAGDGSAAVDLLHSQKDRIDLILLDMTLPGISSREVLREAVRIKPDIRIILTSAYARDTALSHIDAPQVKGFIRKPFQLGEVIQLLSTTLSS
jgi:PAS domain S-box-containing protein